MASDEGRPSTSDSPDAERPAVPTTRLAPEDINLIAGAVADILCRPWSSFDSRSKIRYFLFS